MIYSSDILKLCNSPDSIIINHSILENNILKKDLSVIVDNFLTVSKEIDFSDFFHDYWLSTSLPLPASIVFLSSSIESIKKAWHKSQRSRSKGLFLPKNEYMGLIGDELPILKNKLKDYPKIFNKIEYAYQMGSFASFFDFFKEIEININEVERQALNKRHKYTHGSKITANDWILLILMTEICKTLINRITLKILNYNGHYKDLFSNRGIPLD